MADVNDNVVADDTESTANDGETIDPTGEMDTLIASITELVETPEVKEVTKVPEVVKPATEPEKKEEQKPDDRGMERLAAKEKEVREKSEAFEKERGQYVKHTDLTLNPTAVLKKVGIDTDVLMKTMLYEKLPDSNPVKAKLKVELQEILTNKKIKELDDKYENDKRQKQIAEANAKNYSETVDKIAGFADKLKANEDSTKKTFPILSELGTEGKDLVKELILEEMINDATHRYAKGEDGDPISHEEAATRIEKRLARVVALIRKQTAETNSTGSTVVASGTPGKKKTTGVVKPGPANARTQVDKTPSQEADDLLSRVLRGN